MINSIEEQIKQYFIFAFNKAGYDSKFAQIIISSRPELGHFQCNGAMPLAKIVKNNPLNVANIIIENLEIDEGIFLKIEAVKPGFINITLQDKFLANYANTQAKDKALGCNYNLNSQNVIIDFGGPNIAKPMHVGHIRSTFLGDCLQRVYRFCGDNVKSDVHLGDWGTQMGMLIKEIEFMQPDLPYFDDSFNSDYPIESPVTVQDLAKIYPQASLRCKADENAMNQARQATADLQNKKLGYLALWHHFVDVSINALKYDFNSLGVSFDLWKGESDVQNLIPEMVKFMSDKGFAIKSNGAIIVPIKDDDGTEISPLILVKSDGAYMYSTTDLATILDRVEKYHADKIIYVVDKRQSLHFKQVFNVAKKTNISKNCKLIHIGFGTVNGLDGKPFKTRNGGVMHLSELVKEAKSRLSIYNKEDIGKAEQEELTNKIAMATIKFADLSNCYDSNYIFDLEKFSQFEGKTGPYLLYSAVRIKSILRKLKVNSKDNFEVKSADKQSERNLQLLFMQLPNVILKTYEKCEPHHICDYAFKLATLFNKFYAECNIMKEDNDSIKFSRVAMCSLTLKHLDLTLSLLGIEIPEFM